MSKKLRGFALWQKAKALIPGGNQLLSKRPEMFLPNGWPTYFEKSKDVYVWDLEGVKHLDMCLMGVGTNILGYANASVDESVIQNIKKGNLTTLNCPEEVWLAEKLVEMHDWADMVRFARSGGSKHYFHSDSTSCFRSSKHCFLRVSRLARLVFIFKFSK